MIITLCDASHAQKHAVLAKSGTEKSRNMLADCIFIDVLSSDETCRDVARKPWSDAVHKKRLVFVNHL